MLPELDDDFALDAAGMDSLAELREDVRARLLEVDERAVEREFREAVLDAAADAATVTVPAPLVEARAKEAWEARLHALSHQGVSKEAYLRISGMTEEELIESARPGAERALRAEAVIAAIIEAEKIEPTDEDLLAVHRRDRVSPTSAGRPPIPRSCSRSCASRAASRACARTSPSARRSTASSRPPSRSPRSARPPARSSGPRVLTRLGASPRSRAATAGRRSDAARAS